MTHGRSFTQNAAKYHLLGDGVYIRRWHAPEGAGVEVGVRNGDHEFEHVLLSPTVIDALLKYLYIDGYQYVHEPPSLQPPADERAA